MDTPNKNAEQKPHPGSPSRDPLSDLEIIEIGDSPVKRTGSPKLSVKKRKSGAKSELQMAPMFSQMATASNSTVSGQQLKRKRSSADEPTLKGFEKDNRGSGPAPSHAGQVTRSAGPRVDPLKAVQPLAERMRPTSLSDYVGQSGIVGPGSLLGSMLTNMRRGGPSDTNSSAPEDRANQQASSLGSFLLWGPPGVGKTTLARLIANYIEADFKELSATSSGAADVRKVFEQAKNQLRLTGRRTVLFIDEIHRFTKPQQDLFLPFVENGWVTLIGATTENPSFKVNGALLSRCRVFTLEKHSPAELEQILRNAISSMPQPVPHIPTSLIPFLAEVSDGDARQALNGLELALSVCKRREAVESRNGDVTQSDAQSSRVEGTKENAEDGSAETDADRFLMDAIKKGLRKGYDRTGEERYDMISAMHKSIRGSDGSAALYWLARMLEGGEDPLYVARRLVVVASEDVGLGDPQGLPLAMACYQACQVIGLPECRINLAHCVAYLSEAKKSTRAYEAYNKAVALANESPLPGPPLSMRNAPTSLMKQLGYGKDYSYNPGFAHPVHNEYIPASLAESSTFGSASLLQTEEQYEGRVGKEWNEGKLREWELMHNGGEDWPGRADER
ncbi:DNA-dependent ATPase mgs1 [Naganishia albida]|nr:DNA-dependent ATPase mgs1 [Naganishia albida]